MSPGFPKISSCPLVLQFWAQIGNFQNGVRRDRKNLIVFASDYFTLLVVICVTKFQCDDFWAQNFGIFVKFSDILLKKVHFWSRG